MKQSVMLTIASVLSMLVMTLHLADDIVRGFEKGGQGLWRLQWGRSRKSEIKCP